MNFVFMLCKVLRVSSQLLSWMAHSPCGILKHPQRQHNTHNIQVVLRYQFTAQMWRNWSRKETSTRVRYHIYFFITQHKSNTHISLFYCQQDIFELIETAVDSVTSSLLQYWLLGLVIGLDLTGKEERKGKKKNSLTQILLTIQSDVISAQFLYRVIGSLYDYSLNALLCFRFSTHPMRNSRLWSFSLWVIFFSFISHKISTESWNIPIRIQRAPVDDWRHLVEVHVKEFNNFISIEREGKKFPWTRKK